MSINKGLCSLEKLTSQNQKLERNTRNTRNPVVILQNCYLQNPTSWLYPGDKFTITLQQQKCGGQILSKENDIAPPSYLLSFVFSVNFVLPLLLCVIESNNELNKFKGHTINLNVSSSIYYTISQQSFRGVLQVKSEIV